MNDNISSEEFITLFKAVVELTLHMFLNDTPITLNLLSCNQRKDKENLLDKFDFEMYKKSDFYCIDGFPTEGMPGVVVLPAP